MGFADVYRFGDAFVLADTAEGEDDVDPEASELRAIAGHPTTKAKRIGTVDVPSGVLVLMGAEARPREGEEERRREDEERRRDRGRVRIVAAGTKVVEGEPLLELAPAPAAHAPKAGNHRYLDAKKAAKAKGTLAWQTQLGKPKYAARHASVQLVGDHLLVLAYPFDRLLVLDPATGKVRRTLKIPSANQPRGRDVPRRPLPLDVEQQRMLRVRHEALEAPPHHRGRRGRRRLLGSRKALVRVIDPKAGKKLASFDAAPERARKPSIEAFACTPKHIAISRVDGTTALVDAKTRKILRRFEKHVTQHYFGPPVVFSQDGATLWVGACPKGPVGLSGYDVRALTRATS